MKKTIALFLALAMVLSFAGCSGSGASSPAPSTAAPAASAAPAPSEAPPDAASAGETIELRLGHANAVDQPPHIYSQMWADKVKELSGGRINVTVYPAGQLGTLNELQEAVEYGTLDMCVADASMLSNVVPEYALLALPFMFNSYEHAEKVVDGEIGQALIEKLANEHSMRTLGWFWNGFRIFCTNKKITSVKDCAGIKLRSPEAQIYIDTFTTLGMKPTPLPWGDTYTSMQTGIVDGMESGAEAVCTQGFYKLGKYVCNSRHIFSIVGPTINEDIWKSLSKEDQDIMMQAMAEVVEIQRKDSIAAEQGYLDQMAADGAEVTEFENKQEIIDTFLSYWTETAESCGAVEELNQIIELGK